MERTEAERNNYDLTKIMKPEELPEGSYSIGIRSVTLRGLRIDEWTGAFVATALFYQIISGIILFFYYSQIAPYDSTLYIINDVPFGHIILTSHLYMAYAMIGLVYFHMMRQYFIGSYKGAWRWLQWMLGVIMFLLVILTAILGYMLADTTIAMAALHIGLLFMQRSVLGRILPGVFINWLEAILVGNYTTQAEFSHILALHVAVFSTLLLGIFAVHFMLFERSGLATDKPEKGKMVPWYPNNLLYMIFMGVVLVFVVIVFAAAFPQKLTLAYGSLAYGTFPVPDWYITPVYKLMDVAGYGLSTGGVPLVIGIVIFLFFLPFIDRYKKLGPLQRPWVTAFGIYLLIGIAVTTIWGYSQPGLTQSRIMTEYLWWSITVISFLSVYAMRFAKKDLSGDKK
ncbi:cytochrome b [Picrophilus oshimae]|uniref:Cytochrome b subunit of the bc complex n=1 Tax=Picrophilus torridus (strain ATCC 700027 / DSM 9790 / JCM 10055 / NBRC 100828 / KAW 2/3) TaxID=1122961 RepID=A0A8G2FXP3_PICTO|nr:cytochrome bc complex cytochrome b subunit [Picrophilus oshimae]SMD31343.1 Cytochrome b subunit of the bc complex [Picrophilus oshimae DSM 9789]